MFSRIRWRIALSFALLSAALLITASIYSSSLPFVGVVAVVVGGAVLSALVAVGLTGRMIKTIRELTNAARSLASGNFELDVSASSNDELGQLASSFNDMLARLQEKFAVMESEQNRLSAVLNTMSDGVMMIQGDGKVILLNPAAERLFKTRADRAVGHSFIEVVRDHELDDLVRSCLQPGAKTPMVRLIDHGVRSRYIRAIASPIRNGAAVRVLIIFQDVTQLRRADLIRQDFVANVSHELRTPLASLKALVETLEDGALQDPPAAREFLARMHVEVDKLTQLVEELLELSRIESGRVELKLEPSGLGELVAQAANRLREQAERQGLKLEIDVAGPDTLVLADAGRLQQVVMNLVHNAIKFTLPGGRVLVRASRQGAEGIASVQDTGMGIAAEDLPRLFERFYKADKSRTSGGTGLGLAIAKHLVQAHGGRIWAESEGRGRGATFTFALPIAQGPDIVAPNHVDFKQN